MSKKIAAHVSAIHGTGARALVAIHKGEEIIEYKGQLLTTRQASNLEHADADSGHTFLFTLNEKYVIDANVVYQNHCLIRKRGQEQSRNAAFHLS